MSHGTPSSITCPSEKTRYKKNDIFDSTWTAFLAAAELLQLRRASAATDHVAELQRVLKSFILCRLIATNLETETAIVRLLDEIALEETDINPSIVVYLTIRADATHVLNL